MKRYQLKVSPDRKWRTIWRDIEISGSETLDKLCTVILKAFDFTHEHMYEFCMTNRMYSPDNYMYEPDEPGQRSTEAKIDSLGLTEKQVFSLHYDFGDDWMFSIRVEKITDAPKTRPIVTGIGGHLEQYPDFDDDDEMFDDDDELYEADDEEDDEDLADLHRANQEYLKVFEMDLREANLAPKTIDRHLDNAAFYLDVFILHYTESKAMADGASCSVLREFFEDFYVYECIWSSPANLKTTAASIKKFYHSMMAHGYISPAVWKELCDLFKSSVAEWQESCRAALDEDQGYDELW